MKRKFVPMLLILIVIVVILTFMDYRESAQNAAETEASRTELSLLTTRWKGSGMNMSPWKTNPIPAAGI